MVYITTCMREWADAFQYTIANRCRQALSDESGCSVSLCLRYAVTVSYRWFKNAKNVACDSKNPYDKITTKVTRKFSKADKPAR